jgi:hypothetical protein
VRDEIKRRDDPGPGGARIGLKSLFLVVEDEDDRGLERRLRKRREARKKKKEK